MYMLDVVSIPITTVHVECAVHTFTLYNYCLLLGCPFKHWDSDSIARMLTSYGVPMSQVTSILSYAHDSHYQLACQKYFEVTHNVSGTYTLL